ncbi:hypothetical protein SAMN04489761_1252 [Tenacibaculum sp. MAR_2009_124]|uniref:hypothetical protein n=1 Tax=Tenacibaculum sp. MAR_2009_124 TaxID=1250059 RepID=UPI00089C8BF9|nr:hypothetical protein [Tenacibaculum sp. MAR_2009_124]SEB53273.1 hypothetical protein SAMN04489761_1252 [Tenacibaculum sp. MAR_2009_124]
MNSLDKYKKAWDKQPEDANKVSKVDIYKMSRSKSSSIVKWIFIIGVLELVFWAGLNLSFIGNSYTDLYETLHIVTFVNVSIYLHYFIIIVFLFLFYKNYKSISISDDTKTLIKKILKTRKVVKYYVYFNLIYAFIANVIVIFFLFNDIDGLMQYYKTHGIVTPNNKEDLTVYLAVVMFIGLGFMFFILWLFYKLVYGSLLNKLNKNYRELVKLDNLK